MKRPTVNITPQERAGRILLGLVGVVAGLVLLGSAGGALAVVLEVLLVLAGLDLVVTGTLGHCPLWKTQDVIALRGPGMNDLDTQQTPQEDKRGGRGSRWMMIACCIRSSVIT